jgi:ketosteroid isomerase-like protein
MLDPADVNRRLIVRFYEAFDRGDGDTMAACYASEATFQDPVFGTLDGREAGEMWRFLTRRAPRLDVDLLDHDADDSTGRARWRARYEFSATGRPVVNDVQARFGFEDGLIVDHVDSFSFFSWARQALGLRGLAVGWSPMGRSMVRRRALADLHRSLRREGPGVGA